MIQVTVNVEDINEAPKLLDSTTNQDTTDKHLYKVAEATTAVTTLLASDPDAADQNALSFRIVDDSSATETEAGLFQIDAATGELSLINPPDYEALKENGNWIFDITVEVQDNGGPGNELDANGQAITLNDRRHIQVEIVDVDQHDVEFLDPADNGSVAEGSPAGTAVGITANAIDRDATNNTITYSLSDSLDGALFTINPISGIVTVKNADGIDFETAQNHTIEVIAESSDGSKESRQFTISVEDVIEALPFFNSSATRNLDEGTTTVTTTDEFVDGQAITDPESEGPYTYSITGGSDQSLFNVDASNGSLSFITAPDFENPSDSDTNNIYSVEITASNAAGSSTVTRSSPSGLTMSMSQPSAPQLIATRLLTH